MHLPPQMWLKISENDVTRPGRESAMIRLSRKDSLSPSGLRCTSPRHSWLVTSSPPSALRNDSEAIDRPSLSETSVGRCRRRPFYLPTRGEKQRCSAALTAFCISKHTHNATVHFSSRYSASTTQRTTTYVLAEHSYLTIQDTGTVHVQ